MLNSSLGVPFRLARQLCSLPESLLYLFPFQDETHVITGAKQHQVQFVKQSTALLLNQSPFEFLPEKQLSCNASQKQSRWRQEQLRPSLVFLRSPASCRGH